MLEWIQQEDTIATVGITKEALEEIGEIVFVELPLVGAEVEQGQEVVVLESTKAAIDLYSPLKGTVCAVNTALQDNVQLLNSHPKSEGWLYKLRPSL